MESWDEWLFLSEPYEHLDFGFTDPTPYSVGEQRYLAEQLISREAADFIGHVSELPSGVEVGTPPKQYAEQYGVGYEYQDIH